MKRSLTKISLCLTLIGITSQPTVAQPKAAETVECEVLIAGGGLAGAATAYESLLAGRTVCLTEITDWLGGQISSQGTSALDERPTQRSLLYYPRGYLELREKIKDRYGELNPGDCWVSESCFLPEDGHEILFSMLEDAARQGNGNLKWFPSTVIKEVSTAPTTNDGEQLQSAIAIQHQPAPNAPPLNTYPLSQTIEDAYRYEDSQLFTKNIIRFVPPTTKQETPQPANWYVVDATETGEIIALADVPYRLGIDPRSYREPSSASLEGDRYCTQGFTYTFAMEATEEPQTQEMPEFYPQYEPYYSYELERLADFDLVFTYRRIWSPDTGEKTKFRGIGFTIPTPGDISMQNWTWGNDYRPGTSQDNLIYTREQLEAAGQLAPGGWLGGLRTETLARGEEHSLGYYYWLVAGDTDSQLGAGFKTSRPNHRFLSGLDSPMGTVHGLSKYPYMREARRIIGRPSFGYEEGFDVAEIDISRQDYRGDFYQKLPEDVYRRLWTELAGTDALDVLTGAVEVKDVERRSRSRVYPDSVGIAHYAIDFHPCMVESPPEKPGNTEREGERQGAGQAYPFEIPLRALIPQKIDNFLVVGKSIATSHIAAAAYRVHSFEWSSGAAAGATIDFVLDEGMLPYELVDELPLREAELQTLRRRLQEEGNPVAFPNNSIFRSREDWR